MRGVVLAGTRSGVGKTAATLAVTRALAAAGHTVQPAKAGPDYIDPSHHAAVAGRPSRTVDPWLQGVDGARRALWRGADADVCVVEGMMGLYDGEVCSTARVAATLGLPVVLVVDGEAGAASVAATALGFREYAARADHTPDVVGVLAQRTHGGRHAAAVREALPAGLRWVGHVPPLSGLAVPERHLGLELADETPVDDDALARAAETVDTDTLLDLAATPRRPGTEAAPSSGLGSGGGGGSGGSGGSGGGSGGSGSTGLDGTAGVVGDTDADDDDPPRIAVADDAAFCFRYPGTAARLRAAATLRPFSPVAGDDLPACEGVYLPGGYPELYAAEIAASPALATLADRASEGLPVVAECGGLMALAESLTTADGTTHEMAGVLPATVEMRETPQALDHVELRARRDSPVADAGERLRGHEFHFSAAEVAPDARFAFDVARGDGVDGAHDGLLEHRTLGSYTHLHAASGAFDTFLARVS